MKTTRAVTWYIFKNLFKLILVLLAVSVICFILVSASPVDPIQMYVGEVGMRNIQPETMAKLQSYFGLDTPMPVRYFNWLSDFVRGDMGTSLIYRQPVINVISVRFANSLILMLTAWLLSGLLGFFMGVISGVKRGKLTDKLVKGYSLLLASTPTFWLALVMLVVFSVWLGWFPVGLSVPIGVDAADVTVFDTLRHLFLPALTLSVIGVANIALHTREKMIDVLDQDYVLYAKARGESTFSILRRHGIRNVILPAITIQFASIGEIFGGSVLVEQVFSYPGLGQSAVNAGLSGDAPLLLGIAVISAALVFSGNFIANVLYSMIDPRIRRGWVRD